MNLRYEKNPSNIWRFRDYCLSLHCETQNEDMNITRFSKSGLSAITSLLQRSEGKNSIHQTGGGNSQPADNQPDIAERLSAVNKTRKRRRQKARILQTKITYHDYDEDFFPGEEVSGIVAYLQKTKKHHLQYLYIDLDDGRHTRVHVRSFDVSGRGHLTPEALRPGDRLTLRKTGYTEKFHNTCWQVQSAPLAALLRPDRTPISGDTTLVM